ncbi:MAG: hypothetical protein JXQ90_08690 [Cyclobacteriaceae bacterium]
MKTNMQKMWSMIFVLGAMAMLVSCGGEDPDDVTFDSDPDAFCAANPFDSNCCLPQYNVECHCETGTNAEDDLVNCCLFDFNPTCFCENNPDDEQCQQDFGLDNGLGVILDFESGDASFPTDVWNPSGLMGFDTDAEIEAIEGDHYYGLKIAAGTDNKAWHDIKYWPSAMDDDENNDADALIDLSTMSNPTLNMWVNSGTDTLGFTIAFREGDDEYAVHPLFKAGTGGEWKLFSFPIVDMTAQENWDGGSHAIDLNRKWQMIKFAYLPDDWHVPGNYNAQLDAVSITDGPIEQLPWVK